MDISDQEIQAIKDEMLRLSGDMVSKDLIAILKPIMLKIEALRAFRALELQAKGESEKSIMYRRVIGKPDLFPHDFDPIISAWNRKKMTELNQIVRDKNLSTPDNFEAQTFPMVGDRDMKHDDHAMPQPANMGGAYHGPMALGGASLASQIASRVGNGKMRRMVKQRKKNAL